MGTIRQIKQKFPTKEILFKFIKSYYKIFSKKLGITSESSFDSDLIDAHVGSYWQFWKLFTSLTGKNEMNVNEFFFIMNSISENIENLSNDTFTLDNFKVPTFNTFELSVGVTLWETEYGSYTINYTDYITKDQLERDYDDLIEDYGNPYDWDYEYDDTETDDTDFDVRVIEETNREEIYG